MNQQITITINVGSTLSDLERIKYLLENLDIWLLDLGVIVSDEIKINFDKSDWEPLSATTIARKVAGGYPLEPLIRTEAMMQAATGGEWSASKSGKGAIAVLGLPGYSEFHMDGTSYMPARDFTFLSSDFLGKLEDSLAGYLVG